MIADLHSLKIESLNVDNLSKQNVIEAFNHN